MAKNSPNSDERQEGQQTPSRFLAGNITNNKCGK
jgi:hypothetical protein